MYATFLFDPSQLSLVSPLPVVLSPKQDQTRSSTLRLHTPSPLTIAGCFEQLAMETRRYAQAAFAQSIAVPKDFAQRQSNNGKFRLIAEASQLSIGTFRAQLRLVKIDGAKSNIINAWIFPNNPCHYPVFAAELIGVGDAVRVAFLDIQAPLATAGSSRLKDQLKQVALAYAHLPCDEAAPDWATEASLGHYTYARNVPVSQLNDLGACYLEYLDLFIKYSGSHRPGIQPAENQDRALERLHAYQMHHMQHSPGKKFLGNLFGMDWTERFMLDFLFTKP